MLPGHVQDYVEPNSKNLNTESCNLVLIYIIN